MIYFFQKDDPTGSIKIGFAGSAQAVRDRLTNLQMGNSKRLRCLGIHAGLRADEKALHRKFKKYRVQGEWFKPVPAILEYIADKTQQCPKPSLQQHAKVSDQAVILAMKQIGTFRGSTKDLLQALQAADCDKRDLPKTPRKLAAMLPHILSNLRAEGIGIIDMGIATMRRVRILEITCGNCECHDRHTVTSPR